MGRYYHHYRPAEKARAVEIAVATSIENSSRSTGISTTSIAKWLKAAGRTPRRPGNYTNAETGAMGHRLRLEKWV